MRHLITLTASILLNAAVFGGLAYNAHLTRTTPVGYVSIAQLDTSGGEVLLARASL